MDFSPIFTRNWQQSAKAALISYFIIVTRGHRYDQLCLNQIAQKEHAYIGMIGSKKRAAAVKEAVVTAGCSPEVIRKVHSPIGLDIGAKNPEKSWTPSSLKKHPKCPPYLPPLYPAKALRPGKPVPKCWFGRTAAVSGPSAADAWKPGFSPKPAGCFPPDHPPQSSAPLI